MNGSLLSLATLSALLLSSCVFSPNIGQRIREPGEICTGLALPAAGGKVYKANFADYYGNGTSHYYTFYYTEVPEVTFTRRSRLLNCAALLQTYPHPKICDIRPTGRKRLARVCLDKENLSPTYIGEPVDTLPAHATFSHTLPPAPADAPLQVEHRRDYPHAKASWSRRIAAAPFDYLIDPALKAVFYTGEAIVIIAASPFAAGAYYIGELFEQPQGKKNAE